MTEFDILNQIESTSGKNDKLAILKANVNNSNLKDLLHAALDYRKKYYVNKMPDNIVRPRPVYQTTTHDEFVRLLSRLNKREVTGHAALDEVREILRCCDDDQQKWYERVIKRELLAGFSVDTANKAGFDIPEFEVMLATDGKECKKLDQMFKDGAFASPKLDGYRCFAVVADKQVTLYTRNGEVYKNFPSIEESLLKMCGDGNCVLDGEIMSDNFNSMQKSAFASTRGTTVGDVKYHIFDYIPYEEYVNATFKTKSEERLKMLNSFSSIKSLAGIVNPNIVFVQHTKVSSQKEIFDLEIKYASEGYEGAMLRPNIPYYMGKKSNRMLKFKTMLSMDCVVEGIYEGENRNAGRLGGLSIRQENGESCDVGSGFTDGDRESIFHNPSSVLGRTCEIKYQELTPDGKMRFPIFIRWRDMGGKKI